MSLNAIQGTLEGPASNERSNFERGTTVEYLFHSAGQSFHDLSSFLNLASQLQDFLLFLHHEEPGIEYERGWEKG
jgi:hypothetical protein